MLSLVSLDTILGHEVILLDEGSVDRCVALACSLEYHMTGEYDRSKDLLSLGVSYDKTIIVWNRKQSSATYYNLEGAGCIILAQSADSYKLVTTLDSEGQHTTCYSRFYPLVVSLLEHKS